MNIHPGTSNEKNVGVSAPLGSAQSGLVTQNDERLGGCRLTIDGVKIALEVCLDHIAGGAGETGRASSLEGTTQILLIPSYGMDIGTGLYCVPNGVAFNVDGRDDGSTEVVVKSKGGQTLHKHTPKGARGTIAYSDALAIPYT